MADKQHGMVSVAPAQALNEIASAVPSNCHDNIVVIGSLAVGYHYFGNEANMVVRTKDADCLLTPRIEATQAGVDITNTLLGAGWTIREDDAWAKPGDENTPDDELPAVRLEPPNGTGWFIELLAVPESPADRKKTWTRMATRYGHFGLPSFGYLSLVNANPTPTSMGIRVADPCMMALANLLEHPRIGQETMSAGFAGRADIKRSNKDLGRVLAIAYLAMAQDADALLAWSERWRDVLRDRFPDEWHELASRAGDGLRAVLASSSDMEQAWHTCVYGLLSSQQPTLDELKVAGERLVGDAIEPLEKGVR